MKLRADRRLGEMLSPEQIEREKGGRPENSLHDAMSLTKYQQTLRDNRIEPTAAHRWQLEACCSANPASRHSLILKEQKAGLETNSSASRSNCSQRLGSLLLVAPTSAKHLTCGKGRLVRCLSWC